MMLERGRRMGSLGLRSGLVARCSYGWLCALVAACVAHSLIHGEPAGAVAAAAVTAGMFLYAYAGRRGGGRPRGAGEPVPAPPRARRTPGFHGYVTGRLGTPGRPLRWLVRF